METPFGIPIPPLGPDEEYVNFYVRLIAPGVDANEEAAFLLHVKQDGTLLAWMFLGVRKYNQKKPLDKPKTPPEPPMEMFD